MFKLPKLDKYELAVIDNDYGESNDCDDDGCGEGDTVGYNVGIFLSHCRHHICFIRLFDDGDIIF